MGRSEWPMLCRAKGGLSGTFVVMVGSNYGAEKGERVLTIVCTCWRTWDGGMLLYCSNSLRV